MGEGDVGHHPPSRYKTKGRGEGADDIGEGAMSSIALPLSTSWHEVVVSKQREEGGGQCPTSFPLIHYFF
jgi:hypothetical protein